MFLIAQDCQRLEIYSQPKAWDLALYTDTSDVFNFESVDLKLTLSEIYQYVEFSD